MSQKVRILGAKVDGDVYLGVRDLPDGTSEDLFSSAPEGVVSWLWDGHRGRFNQRRALRGRFFTQRDGDGDGVISVVTDDAGEPILMTLGDEIEDERRSAARVSHPHWAALPDLLLLNADESENKEWFAAHKRRASLRESGHKGGRLPSFRSRRHEPVRFGVFCDGGKNAVFTKTGRRSGVVTIKGRNPAGKYVPGHARWALKIRVRLSQTVRDFTSVRVDWSARSLVFVSSVPVREHAATGREIGIDLGVTRTIATSDGEFFDAPKTDDLDRKIKQESKGLARKRRLNRPAGARNWVPTANYADQRTALSALHAAQKRRLDDWRHKTTTALVASADVVAYESLKVKNMTRSAAGTLKDPGTNVAQKRGLNRSLAQASFATLREMLEYKARAAGVSLAAVNPYNTSRACFECGHTAKENRESQAVFRCEKCGHTANADINAARNILRAGQQGLATQAAGRGRAPSGNIGCKTGVSSRSDGASSPKTTRRAIAAHAA